MIIHRIETACFGVKDRTPEETRGFIYDLENLIKQAPQIEIPVVHKFADGLYYREILIPKGTVMTGRIHKQNDLNIVYYGDMEVLTENGLRWVIGAESFPGKAGIKQFGIAHEDTLWATVHHTHLTDLDELEKELFEDEESLFDFKTGEVSQAALAREDFKKVLREAGISPEQARAETEITSDLHPMSMAPYGVIIKESNIQGLGAFVTRKVESDGPICYASVDGKRTQAGRYTNHSHDPNAYPLMGENGDIIFMAKRGISIGEEITIDYRETLALRGRFLGLNGMQEVVKCRQP